MRAFKATDKNLTCRGTFRYRLGEKITESEAKCARNGLHCCENPLDCLHYYGLGKGNRYFRIEAEGDINEDGTDTRISCTEMTLVEELDLWSLCKYGMEYIILHPRRKWEQRSGGAVAAKDQASATMGIAIARGREPRVKGAAGTVLGLLKEDEDGDIIAARLFRPGSGKYLADAWYTVGINGEIRRAER